tara:strand:+ start:469 stop:639 length:171 start_codon:yes stop_codon:yes gene_type:complete
MLYKVDDYTKPYTTLQNKILKLSVKNNISKSFINIYEIYGEGCGLIWHAKRPKIMF